MPLIDTHCHDFAITRESSEFARCVAMSADPHDIEDDKSTLTYMNLINYMRRFYGLPENTPDDEVIRHRNSLYHNDPAAYVKSLLDDSKVKCFFNDIGAPVMGPRHPKEENEWFMKVMPKGSVREIVRIEPVMKDLFAEQRSFHDYLDTFIRRTKEQIRQHHAVGLKSVIGYHTGLFVNHVSDEKAKDGYDKYLSGKYTEEDEKNLRDYMIPIAMDICKETDLPMQFHSGIGAAPMCNMNKMNPMGLYNLMNDSRYKGQVKMILLHAGYPWTSLTGLLVNNFSHVYSDWSSMGYTAHTATYRMILQMLEMAPTNKVMYASDTGGYPETMWFTPVYFKEQLAKALEKYIADGIMTYDKALQISANICYKTAERVYSKVNE